MKKIILFFLVLLICTISRADECLGVEQKQEDTTLIDANQWIDQYQFTDLDEILTKQTGIHMNFKNMISNIVQGNTDDLSMQSYIKAAGTVISSNKNAVVQILLIGILSAILKNFSFGFGDKLLNNHSQMIISLILISVLMAVYLGALVTTTNILSTLIRFYQAICPIFFPAVIMVGGNVSAAAYYQIVMTLITVVDYLFKGILLKIDSFYMLLGIADSVTQEEHFSKACELLEGCIKYVSRTVLVVFLGLNGIKGMITPFLDTQKNSLLCRALSVIPGIGNTAVAISKTMVGAGTIVKNSIGAASVVAFILISMIPIIKLVLLVILYKGVAAALEPITGKNVVNAVNFCSKAIGNLLQITLVTLALFVLTVGMICLATNVSVSAWIGG